MGFFKSNALVFMLSLVMLGVSAVSVESGPCDVAPCSPDDVYTIWNFGDCAITVDIVWEPFSYCSIDVDGDSEVEVCVPAGTVGIEAVFIEGESYPIGSVGPSKTACPEQLVLVSPLDAGVNGIEVL